MITIIKAKQIGFVIIAENGYGFFSMTEENRELVLNEKDGKWFDGKERVYKFN